MIRAYKTSSVEAGGCNACPAPTLIVWEIKMGEEGHSNLSIRLCPRCMKHLRRQTSKKEDR